MPSSEVSQESMNPDLHQEPVTGEATKKNVFKRIGQWFRRGSRIERELTIHDDAHPGMIERTGRFETPWARRERNMQNLQRAFVSVADLMTSVRDNLEKQSQRQDELLQYLSHLPAAIQAIPESNRVQGETLKAIYQQLAHQNEQQDRLAEILEKLHDAGGAQKEVAEEIRERVETLNDHNQRISETLHGVGSAMQSVSKASNTSAEVLQSLQETISHRDAELERVLHKQNTRFTTMLTIAILLSVAALTAVVIMGYLMMSRMGKI